jgi:cytidine deaminase
MKDHMDQLRQAAIAAAQRSHSPYSLAKVGCALVTENGTEYRGCNIENSSFGGTVCAERVAIWKAVSEGHQRIKRVYVYTDAGWPPCGLCRQVMSEFATADLEIVIGDKSGHEQTWKFNDLMPLAFTPEHLTNK